MPPRLPSRPAPASTWGVIVVRALVLLGLLLGLMLASGIDAQGARAARPPPPDEASLHAAYVINFIRYSKWPASRAASQAYVIAVLGPPESVAALRQLCERAGPVQGRALRVRALPLNRIAPAPGRAIKTLRQELDGAHVVYVAESHRAWNQAAIAAVAGRPVLTVGVGAEFVEAGGMFGLTRNKGQVAFSVNEAVIRRHPVEVSARVLVLARPTRPGNP